jgi:hypothetical protein
MLGTQEKPRRSNAGARINPQTMARARHGGGILGTGRLAHAKTDARGGLVIRAPIVASTRSGLIRPYGKEKARRQVGTGARVQ